MANEFKSVSDDHEGLDEVVKFAKKNTTGQGMNPEIFNDCTNESGNYFHTFEDPMRCGLAADDDEFMPIRKSLCY